MDAHAGGRGVLVGYGKKTDRSVHQFLLDLVEAKPLKALKIFRLQDHGFLLFPAVSSVNQSKLIPGLTVARTT